MRWTSQGQEPKFTNRPVYRDIDSVRMNQNVMDTVDMYPIRGTIRANGYWSFNGATPLTIWYGTRVLTGRYLRGVYRLVAVTGTPTVTVNWDFTSGGTSTNTTVYTGSHTSPYSTYTYDVDLQTQLGEEEYLNSLGYSCVFSLRLGVSTGENGISLLGPPRIELA